MGIRQADGLELDQDLAFVQRSWRLQRVGWMAMGTVLVLALAGLLGSGPLSRREARLPGLLRVEYQRFTRYEAPQALAIHLEPAATRTGEVSLWIDRGYLDDAKLETLTPPPARVEAAGDRLVYVFPVRDPGGPLTIAVILESRRIGPTAGRIGLVGADGFAGLRQFVYP